jgi:hypothetical protein
MRATNKARESRASGGDSSSRSGEANVPQLGRFRCADSTSKLRLGDETMAENLLRDTWADLDQADLRLLLKERIGQGQLGQYDGDDENVIYLPLAREKCRVSLT